MFIIIIITIIITVTPDSVTELAHSMLKSFTPQTGITIEEENFLA